MDQKMPMLIAFSMLVNLLNAQEMERKAPNLTATYELTIEAPIDTVWKALAIEFDGIGRWASGVNHVVESSGAGLDAERFCEINAKGFNDTRERIIKFDPDNYILEYDLYEGLPGFVKYSINKYQLTEKDGRTHYKAFNEMRVGGVMGATMKGIMKKSLKNVLKAMGEELKYYIETGRQHPNKLAAIAKKEGKQLFVIEQDIQAPASQVWKVIADEFDQVANSHPVSPKSAFTNGSTNVQVGSQRIMYMTKNENKYFVDEILRLNPQNRELLINVVEAKGYPV
ncbi:MAG: SRPBCC family protein, partial [Bacteroidota bacterium]